MKTTHKKKRKLNFKKLIILILFLYFLGYSGYYILTMPTKNIVITGNTLIKDSEIIEIAGLKNYPPIFKISKKILKNKIKSISLIESVEIKRNLKFKLTIEVVESKVVFINNNNNTLMLSSGKSIPNNNEYAGIPTLINYTDMDILKAFTLKFGQLDPGIISLISEIRYAPTMSDEGISIDETRFILYMNDGNIVYTNVAKCNVLSHYREIYASLKDKKGILNLDSGNYDNFYLKEFGAIDELPT